MEFSISRIHTPVGIFRLKGDISSTGELSYSIAEFMGSDGWVEINLGSKNGQSVLGKIESDILLHLLT